MNVSLLWALSLAVLLAGGGWLWVGLARRAGRRRAAPREAPAGPATRPAPPGASRPPSRAPGPLPAPATADSARVAAQRALATEALRQARRRAADDAAQLAAGRLAAGRLAAPPVPAWPRPRPALATPAAAPVAARPSVAVPPALAVPPTVLVVDDSKVVRIKTSRLLEKHHYRVLLADDGLAALLCLAQQPVDLVITDVEMPGLDGFGLTRGLRAQPRWAGLPVIMITSSDDKHRSAAAAVGVSVLLGKPYAEAALLAEVHQALARARRPANAARAGAALALQ